jgi:hypothetical protein
MASSFVRLTYQEDRTKTAGGNLIAGAELVHGRTDLPLDQE